VRTLVRQQLSSFVRGARWLWPILTYLLVLILLTALAIRPAHAAYGFIAPVLVLTAAWFGWLVSSATEPPLFQVTMVAVGARERALGARWIAAALTTVPLFLLGVIAAEIGRQAGSSGTGLWWAGVGLHLLDTLLGAGLGVLLGAQLTEREGRPVPTGESTPLAALIIVLVCGIGAVGYLGAVGALALLVLTVLVTLSALTT
jgi:hypothetical protein